MASGLTLADLRRWTDNGATWRLMPRAPEPPLIELCTCYGEAVDVVEPAPDLIEALERREIIADDE
ncbi:MAG TPA: hypothetical protein VFP55_09415 [Solirubrobacteraceae bacterium]|nr:hypothetical protein [Solirubrobacteraceae bacterium]